MAAVRHPGFRKFKSLVASRIGRPVYSIVPNVIKIGQTVAEYIVINGFEPMISHQSSAVLMSRTTLAFPKERSYHKSQLI